MSNLPASIRIRSQLFTPALCDALITGTLSQSQLSPDGLAPKQRTALIDEAWDTARSGWSTKMTTEQSEEWCRSVLHEVLNVEPDRQPMLTSTRPRATDPLWSLYVTAKVLRIQRRSPVPETSAIEFDLTRIFVNNDRRAFRLMWLLCHPSRWTEQLEAWRHSSRKAFHKNRTALRKSVMSTMQSLSNALLGNPDNTELIQALRNGELSAAEFHHHLIRLVLMWMLIRLDDSDSDAMRDKSWASFKACWTATSDEPGEPLLVRKLREGPLRDANCGELEWYGIYDTLGKIKSEGDGSYLDWRTMGLADLAAVYEYLLDVEANLDIESDRIDFSLSPSKTRSESGAYYTPPGLVHHLLEQTLDRQMAALAWEIQDPDEQVAALLALRICDPTCGAGNFLLGAAHRLAQRIAHLRAGERVPTRSQVNRARQEVVSQCLYGIDINPMAVDLCELSLWRFAGGDCTGLRQRVQVGNALIGSLTSIVEWGVPASAFQAHKGDHKATVRRLRKESEGHEPVEIHPRANRRLLADLWCAAFLMRKTNDNADRVPTMEHWNMVAANCSDELPHAVRAGIDSVRSAYEPVHWELRFPEVFKRGGFDLVVGNPPFINQLARGKALPRHDVALLAHTLDMTVGYADVASLILLWTSRLLTLSGMIAMVQPLSIVVTDSSEPVRRQLLSDLQLRHVWATDAHIFEDAMVFACTLAFQSGTTVRPINRSFSNDFHPCSTYTTTTEELLAGAAKWGKVMADLFGFPSIKGIQTGDQRLNAHASATAGFRDQYYFPKDCARERDEVGDAGYLRIITSGAIHPLRSQFALKPARYAKRKFSAPVFPVELLKENVPDIWRWFKGIGEAKLLMAQQSSVLRVMVDVEADCYPMVPVLAIVPNDPGACWKLSALLVSPVATAWVLTNFLGGGMHPNSIKVSADQLLGLPLPRHEKAWEMAAKHAQKASQAQTVDRWKSALIACGSQMNAAYGIEDMELLRWWEDRLPNETL